MAPKKSSSKDGKIRGVRTEKGDEVGAKYVVSNASTLSTYLELIGEEIFPERS